MRLSIYHPYCEECSFENKVAFLAELRALKVCQLCLSDLGNSRHNGKEWEFVGPVPIRVQISDGSWILLCIVISKSQARSMWLRQLCKTFFTFHWFSFRALYCTNYMKITQEYVPVNCTSITQDILRMATIRWLRHWDAWDLAGLHQDWHSQVA